MPADEPVPATPAANSPNGLNAPLTPEPESLEAKADQAAQKAADDEQNKFDKLFKK